MNVLFHTTAAIGVVAIASKINTIEDSFFSKASVKQGLFLFLFGLISHGVLDFIPHCYPINSKIDSILSLSIMILTIYLVKKKYKLGIIMAFFGSVFPDLVDLSPAIINSYLGTSIPEFEKLFPWHWHQYSGSIYSNQCGLSIMNHSILIALVGLIIWIKRKKFRQLF